VPYSLVSAATLGFDLVRLPAGRDVADALLAGLTADATVLSHIAGAHPAVGRDRAERGVVAVRARRAREMAVSIPHVRNFAVDLPAGTDRTDVLVDQLQRSTIGDAAALERIVRDDVLGPEHPGMADLAPEVGEEAADVLADAAVGHWAAEVLPPLVRRELTAPYTRAVAEGLVAPAPVGADLGPAWSELADLLAAVRGLDDDGRARWRLAVDEGRAEHRTWATAMHEASWAAHVSGRTRSLATAQLQAVRAFRNGGFDTSDGAAGVWNAVAGCVHGTAMADLLDEASLAVLLAPWRRVTGTA
jgi:hypothetical protein